MKNNHYTQSEIENLSAYLDHELTKAEEAQMRSRLAEDASLREALEDLRLTRYTLRNTPRVRRQRSFVLTPEMVRQQKTSWRAFSFSRAISIGASVLFALVIGGEVLSGGGIGMMAAAPQENAAVAVYDEAASMEADEPMMMQEMPEDDSANSAMGTLLEESEDTFADDAESEPAAEEMAMPTETETLAPMPTQSETMLPSAGGGLPPTETPEPTPTEMSVAVAPPPADEGSPSDVAGKDTDGDITMEDLRVMDTERDAPMDALETDTALAETQAQVREPIPAVRWVQIGLLLVALLGGGLASYFRRRVL